MLKGRAVLPTTKLFLASRFALTRPFGETCSLLFILFNDLKVHLALKPYLTLSFAWSFNRFTFYLRSFTSRLSPFILNLRSI